MLRLIEYSNMFQIFKHAIKHSEHVLKVTENLNVLEFSKNWK